MAASSAIPFILGVVGFMALLIWAVSWPGRLDSSSFFHEFLLYLLQRWALQVPKWCNVSQVILEKGKGQGIFLPSSHSTYSASSLPWLAFRPRLAEVFLYPRRVVVGVRFVKKWAFIFGRFKPSAYYFCIVLQGRNLLIGLIPVIQLQDNATK